MVLGAQLYTVRDFTKTKEGLAETLKKVADIGYRSVQISGTCGFEPEWMDAELKKNGLVCPVTHTAPERISGETAAVAAEHRVFGCGCAGIGYPTGGYKNGLNDYEEFRARFAPAAAALKKAGLIMGYHNHQIEFNRYGGKSILERIAEDFPADELTFILDTYWVQFSGGDPAEWINKLGGRVKYVHLKDMSVSGSEQRMAVAGEGNMNFPAIISACFSAGTEYMFVEQDECYGENPFDCLRRSYRYLKSAGLD